MTAAAGTLATSDGPSMLSFFTAVDEIHGSRSIAHLTKGNSNVLAEIPLFGTPHVKGFIKQYCDPGFRR